MALSFQNPRDPDNHVIRVRIAEWLSEFALMAADEVLESVQEESDYCGPACPHTQTVLRVKNGEDAMRELRIARPLVFVRRADVRALAQAT